MALITRFSRLFRADLHAVLDRMEEPDVLLRQALREMDESVSQAASRLKALALEREQCARRARDIDTRLAGIGSELDLCFAANNETLARGLLRQRLEGERLAKYLAQRIQELERLLDEGRRTHDEQQRQLENLRQQVALSDSETARAASGAAGSPCVADLAVSESDIDLAMLRERQARVQP